MAKRPWDIDGTGVYVDPSALSTRRTRDKLSSDGHFRRVTGAHAIYCNGCNGQIVLPGRNKRELANSLKECILLHWKTLYNFKTYLCADCTTRAKTLVLQADVCANCMHARANLMSCEIKYATGRDCRQPRTLLVCDECHGGQKVQRQLRELSAATQGRAAAEAGADSDEEGAEDSSSSSSSSDRY